MDNTVYSLKCINVNLEWRANFFCVSDVTLVRLRNVPREIKVILIAQENVQDRSNLWKMSLNSIHIDLCFRLHQSDRPTNIAFLRASLQVPLFLLQRLTDCFLKCARWGGQLKQTKRQETTTIVYS